MAVEGIASANTAQANTVTIDLPNATLNSTAKTEAPKEQTQAPAVDKEKEFSERFSILSKKEKALLRERQEARALKQQVEQERAQFLREKQELDQFKAMKAASPIEKLKYLGSNYDELTQYYLNNGLPTPEIQVQSVKQELEQFKQQQELERQRQAQLQSQAQQQEYAEVLDQFREEIGNFASEKPEDYELINHFGQSNLVFDTIQEYFNINKKVLSIKEGCDLVEKYLEDQVRNTAKTKKFSKLLGTEGLKDKPQVSQQLNKSQPVTKTLSNGLTPSMPSSLPALTEQQRIQRALAKLGG